MINYSRATDIRHGLIIKENGESKTGIFHGSTIPSVNDDGGVPASSLYIRTNGELWQKKSTLASSWILIGAGGANPSRMYTFSREDASAICWLTTGDGHSSDKIGNVLTSGGTQLLVSLAIRSPGVSTVILYKRNTTNPTYIQIGTISTFATERVAISTIAAIIVAGDEIGAKVTAGDSDFMLQIEVI